MKPLSSTISIVEWDELPANAREIPVGFNPLDDGVLMKHQAVAMSLRKKYTITAYPKGRRTGVTFAAALDSVLDAAASKEAGGDNVFYIPDTKDKGLEFIGYCAKFSRVIAEAQHQGVSQIENFLFEDQDEQGNTKYINAYRIRYSSGFQIVALSSRPANIRGLQGRVIIDEAAFHRDVQAVLDAATALLIWGGSITVISSENGKNNPFHVFCRDIENGKYGQDAIVYRITFDDAVANGLFERVCMMKGTVPTEEAKKAWYIKIRAAYGPRKAAMREELDAIARDGNGSGIHGVWIDRAMPEERPILRIVFDDDFPARPEPERITWCATWIALNLVPLIKLLADFSERWAIGMDFARHRHFSVITPAMINQQLRRDVPFLIELANAPTRQQEQILWALLELLKNWTFAGDATGPGQTLMEYTADKFGRAVWNEKRGVWEGGPVHEVVLSRAWYGLWMSKYIKLFEDGSISLPKDASLEDDHRAVEYIDGIPMVPHLERKDLKDPDLIRHGDSAIAGALMNFAAINHVTVGKIEFQSTNKQRASSDTNGYRGYGGSSRRTNTGGFR